MPPQLIRPQQGPGQVGAGYGHPVLQSPPPVVGELGAAGRQQMPVGSVRGGGKDIPKGIKGILDCQRRRFHLGPQFLKNPGRGCRYPRHFRLHAGIAQGGTPGNTPIPDAVPQGGRKIRRRFPHGSGVAGVGAGQDLQQQGGVGHSPGHRPGLGEVVGRRLSIAAIARHPALRGFDAEQAAETGRNPNGAAAIAAGSQGAEAGGQGRRRPAAGAAGRPRRIPGIAARVAQFILRGAGQAELRGVGLAEDDGPGRLDPFHHYGVVLRDAVVEQGRPQGGGYALGQFQVFDRYRDAVERPQRFPPLPGILGLAGGGQSLLRA